MKRVRKVEVELNENFARKFVKDFQEWRDTEAKNEMYWGYGSLMRRTAVAVQDLYADENDIPTVYKACKEYLRKSEEVAFC